MENITELHSALLAIDKSGADILTKPNTEVTPLAASFLTSHQILQILWRRVLSPVMFYVGFAAPSSVFLLTGSPESFIKMSLADKVSLDSPQQALEYLTIFLEVTRSMDRLFYAIGSVDKIRWRKNLKETEIARIKAIREKYQSIIVPRAEIVGHRYLVNGYAMQDTDLIHIQAFLTAGGTMELRNKILEKNLPSVYGA